MMAKDPGYRKAVQEGRALRELVKAIWASESKDDVRSWLAKIRVWVDAQKAAGPM